MLEVGDKVRVVKNYSGHRFEIGEIVNVYELHKIYEGAFLAENGETSYWLSFREVEKI